MIKKKGPDKTDLNTFQGYWFCLRLQNSQKQTGPTHPLLLQAGIQIWKWGTSPVSKRNQVIWLETCMMQTKQGKQKSQESLQKHA